MYEAMDCALIRSTHSSDSGLDFEVPQGSTTTPRQTERDIAVDLAFEESIGSLDPA